MIIKAIKAFVVDYLSRHKNNIDRILHIIGVPMAFYGVFILFAGAWKAGLLCLFFGYLFQWIGHTYFEKNEVGEWILIKKIVAKLTEG
jgi:hypothetical protein